MTATAGWGRAATLALSAMCFFAAPAGSEDANGQKAPSDFVPLWNGVDLAGWKEVQGNAGSFRVEDGVLIGKRERSKGTAYWMSTNEKYHNFILRLEYQLRPKGNSGVFIRVPSYMGRTSRTGMEIQLLDDAAQAGKPGKGNTGAVYDVAPPSAFASKPAGEWNRIEIACVSDRIVVVLNGEKINDIHMDQFDALKNRPREGYIGLSAHTDEVRFRNVALRRLDDDADPLKAIEEVQAAEPESR